MPGRGESALVARRGAGAAGVCGGVLCGARTGSGMVWGVWCG